MILRTYDSKGKGRKGTGYRLLVMGVQVTGRMAHATSSSSPLLPTAYSLHHPFYVILHVLSFHGELDIRFEPADF